MRPARSSCTLASRPSTSGAATTCCSPSSPRSATTSRTGCGRAGSPTRPFAARTGKRTRERSSGIALKYAIETFHDDQLADCHADGGDPVRVVAWVASESWLFHQVLVHELGGLERFVDEIATGRLAEHAELARSWVGARLGGYQVGASLPGGRLRVHDPAAGSWLEVLDLGARSNAGDDGWVLGRLVPSGVDDLLMFDTPPIAVPERVARDVAGAPQPWTRSRRRSTRAGSWSVTSCAPTTSC